MAKKPETNTDPIDASFDDVAGSIVKKSSANEVHVTRTEELMLGSVAVPCHVLTYEIRVLSGRGMQRSLGFQRLRPGWL